MLKQKGKITIFQQQDQQPKTTHQQKQKKIAKAQKSAKNPKIRYINDQQQSNDATFQKILPTIKHSQVNLMINSHEINQDNDNKMSHFSICFPDSILQIPQTSALRAYFISQIARIASIYKVDEIVILKDNGYTQKSEKFIPCQYIARNLQYLQTPQYLRKYLFKMHPDLNNVGLMNPIQALHHFKADEKSQFRDGVALERPTKHGAGSWVDIGLKQQARMDHLVLPLTRVTLRIKNFEDDLATFYQAEAISKGTPRAEKGLYWGYDVRIAKNFKEMVQNIELVMLCNHSRQTYGLPQASQPKMLDLKQKRVLIYFSGTDDLHSLILRDQRPKWTTQEALNHFNYVIPLPETGVKQLRIEERMSITLSKFANYTI